MNGSGQPGIGAEEFIINARYGIHVPYNVEVFICIYHENGQRLRLCGALCPRYIHQQKEIPIWQHEKKIRWKCTGSSSIF